MIKLRSGHEFEWMVMSGALGYDGLGWWWEKPLVWAGFIKPHLFTVVTKTLTAGPTIGNYRWWKPWDVCRPIDGGVVNMVVK